MSVGGGGGGRGGGGGGGGGICNSSKMSWEVLLAMTPEALSLIVSLGFIFLSFFNTGLTHKTYRGNESLQNYPYTSTFCHEFEINNEITPKRVEISKNFIK